MTISKKELVVIAVAIAALITFASLAAYANANMMASSLGYQQQNQGYDSGMMGRGGAGMMSGGGMMGGAGGMMGGYYSGQGYPQQASPNNNQPQQQYYGQGMMGGGMMGGGGYRSQTGQGTTNQTLAHCGGGATAGGMMGYGGMMGSSNGGMMSGGAGGMMGGGYYQSVPTALTHAQAEQVANSFLASLNNSSLTIGDFDEYSNNFYLSIVDNRTGTGMLEVLIDRFTGSVYPEPQSMMWGNTGYRGGMGRMMMSSGMMGGRYYYTGNGTVTVTPDQAKKIAQQFLNVTYPKTVAGDVETFPGYYTIETTLNGQTYGMLSINSYTGAIWYHTWHGMFITALK